MEHNPIQPPGSASSSAAGLDQAGRRRILTVFTTMILFVMLLFFAVGRIDWLWGWVYLLLSLAVMLGNSFYILRTNPQAINERGRKPIEQKSWDKIIMAIYTPIVLIFPVLVGLDIRLNEPEIPFWQHILGAAAYILGNQVVYWAMANNRFLSMYVAVQSERGHSVATAGPYHYVRHPMYLGIITSWLGQPFLLGSWLSIIPAALAVGIILLRTGMEDRTLIAELPGYADYSHQVRFRLLPGVW